MIQHDVWPVHDELVRGLTLAPVTLGGAEERAWLDCDLASLVENWLGERLDPRGLDAVARRAFQTRVLDEPPMSLSQRSEHERCYWLVEGGERKGTMALGTGTHGGKNLYLASFYVYPTFRHGGVGRRAMDRLMSALRRNDLGLRLDTSWCWQRTVGIYRTLGLWVYMWKRDLSLCWDPETPAPQIAIDDETATLSVAVGDETIVLVRARRRGEALLFDEPAPELSEDTRLGEAYWYAVSTLSLALAQRWWPLVRSAEEWESARYCDAGAPEALAYKITLWEAWARKRGWVVNTPRIPGVEYPTWEQFEAGWQAARMECATRVDLTEEEASELDLD